MARSVLREAIVLAHTVPGAELRLVTDRGELVVGRHPTHDLSPCELRQALLAGAAPGGADCFRAVRRVELGGSLRDLGGGMYELWPSDGSPAQRWFATTLHPRDIVELVKACDLDVADDAMDAGVATDAPLGISAVKVSPSLPEHRDRLDEVARWFLERCVVEELVQRVEAETVPPGG
ncbi:hypothetical protein [Dermatobacter hominis]|uniref:hypothetical protein n=1 Tax=Dermatobacter hominis TaxID=2884263 RepID=UPI001D121A4A|nr:hypothetical protein [Dermatobacter hominis]UDY34692.1 hypothetical protein LH044_15290 [Dermatobacter hominis]